MGEQRRIRAGLTRARAHLVAWTLLILLALAGRAFAQGPPPGPPPPPGAPPGQPASEDPRFVEARTHYFRGVEHADRQEWDAALVEFLKSREILPNAKNTYNAALCLRNVKRFDEALDMYEILLRDYPTYEQRQTAERELAQLRTAVGALELRGGVPGSTVLVDTRDRGKLPLAAPLRVGAGTHAIRVTRDGFLPFEARVDVAGQQTAVVNVQLIALTAGGRLHVAEQTGRALDVVVDGAVVGKTPWDGVLPPGEHTVLLRGPGKVGTPPVRPLVKLNQTVTLNLLAEDLDASVRVQPTPATATVAIDGVQVGRGAWEGRLRAGAHTIEVTADGYLSFRKDLESKKDGADVVDAALARDPKVFAGPSAVFGVEIDAAVPLGASWGGDLASSCAGGCSGSLPLGVHPVLRGLYQGGSGFGVSVDVGYLLAVRSYEARPEVVSPKGVGTPRATAADPTLPPIRENPGTVTDKLKLSALTVGASAQYHKGETWPLLLRLGAGAILGSVKDERAGTMTNSFNEPYAVSMQRSASATYLYVAPEVRIGRRFGSHLELNVGAEVMLLAALSQPKWNDQQTVLTSTTPAHTDGTGTFGEDSMMGSFMVLVAPGVGVRYEF